MSLKGALKLISAEIGFDVGVQYLDQKVIKFSSKNNNWKKQLKKIFFPKFFLEKNIFFQK